jgi:hypothetical protein
MKNSSISLSAASYDNEKREGVIERGYLEWGDKESCQGLGGAPPYQGFNAFPTTFLSTTRNTTAQTPIPTRRTYCESAEID